MRVLKDLSLGSEMKTQVYKINPINLIKPEPSIIKKAVSLLEGGELVVFPTETVYGLAANAYNSQAVAKIFEVKGRSFSKPLAVCLPLLSDLDFFVKEIPGFAEKLMERYLPGPVTLVFKKKKSILEEVTRGAETIGIRQPSNKISLAILKEIKFLLALTSANVSENPSPITFEEAYKNMDGKVDLIIDGGKTELGIESTVVDVTIMPPKVLREGAISQEEIEKFYRNFTHKEKEVGK